MTILISRTISDGETRICQSAVADLDGKLPSSNYPSGMLGDVQPATEFVVPETVHQVTLALLEALPKRVKPTA